MKLKIYTLLLALSVTWSLQSCDNDDDGSIAVPAELQSAFSSKFPNAANVKWETKSGYYVGCIILKGIAIFIFCKQSCQLVLVVYECLSHSLLNLFIGTTPTFIPKRLST